jgi:hypothetical protein
MKTLTKRKRAILDFITDNLKVDNVQYEDIDCSHRVGEVVDGKPTMLFRCYSCDLVQILIKNRYKLKDTSYVLYEDSTYLHRQLLQVLKDEPRTESAWLFNGGVWSKMASNGRIAKFTLLDDVNAKIIAESAKNPGHQNTHKAFTNRNTRAAWKRNKRQAHSTVRSPNMSHVSNTTHPTEPNMSIHSSPLINMANTTLQQMQNATMHHIPIISPNTSTMIPPLFPNTNLLDLQNLANTSGTTLQA